MDIGANHGLYSLYAAALGAEVITVEPQPALCRLIRAAADINVAAHRSPGRVWVYNHAILETRELVSMAAAAIAEGAVATVVRGEGSVQAIPIAELAPKDGGRIAFMKIDVEGFELHALPSAYPLFQAGRVDNVMVEFGPPSRWSSGGAENTVADGLAVLEKLQTQYNMGAPRLLQSYAWYPVMAKVHASQNTAQYFDALRQKDDYGMFLPLTSRALHIALMEGMGSLRPDDASTCCEAELWFRRPSPTSSKLSRGFRTFGSVADCARSEGDNPESHRKPCFAGVEEALDSKK